MKDDHRMDLTLSGEEEVRVAGVAPPPCPPHNLPDLPMHVHPSYTLLAHTTVPSRPPPEHSLLTSGIRNVACQIWVVFPLPAGRMHSLARRPLHLTSFLFIYLLFIPLYYLLSLVSLTYECTVYYLYTGAAPSASLCCGGKCNTQATIILSVLCDVLARLPRETMPLGTHYLVGRSFWGAALCQAACASRGARCAAGCPCGHRRGRRPGAPPAAMPQNASLPCACHHLSCRWENIDNDSLNDDN